MRTIILIMFLSGCLPTTYRSYSYPAVGPYTQTSGGASSLVQAMKEGADMGLQQRNNRELAEILSGRK